MTMKQRLHKLLALVTTFMMLFSSLPVQAIAEAFVEVPLPQNQTQTVESKGVTIMPKGIVQAKIEYWFLHIGYGVGELEKAVHYPEFDVPSITVSTNAENKVDAATLKASYTPISLPGYKWATNWENKEIVQYDTSGSTPVIKLIYDVDRNGVGGMKIKKFFFDSIYNPLSDAPYTVHIKGDGIKYITHDKARLHDQHFTFVAQNDITIVSNDEISTKQNSNGAYLPANLPEGSYEVWETMDGFDCRVVEIPSGSDPQIYKNARVAGPYIAERPTAPNRATVTVKGGVVGDARDDGLLMGNVQLPVALTLKKQGGLPDHTYKFNIKASWPAGIDNPEFIQSDLDRITWRPSVPGDGITLSIVDKDTISISGVTNDGLTIQGLPLAQYTVTEVSYTDENGVEHPFANKDTDNDFAYNDPASGTSTGITNPGDTGSVTLVNDPKVEFASYEVEKVWVDGNNAKLTRPTSITVQLLADGVASGAPVTLNESNGWKKTWDSLPKKNGDATIKYSVQEITEPTGYRTFYNTSATKTTITNTLYKDIDVTKVWIDNGADHGTGFVDFKLWYKWGNEGNFTARGTERVSAANNWKYEASVPAYNTDGYELFYYATEDTKVPGYTTTYSDTFDHVTITNVMEIPTDRKIKIEKTWVDYVDTTRVPVTFKLEKKTASATTWTEVTTVELTADDKDKTNANKWVGEFPLQPHYELVGDKMELVEYRVTEITDVPGYTMSPAVGTVQPITFDSKNEGTARVTNKLNNQDITIKVTKEWIDGDTESDIKDRPASIDLTIYSDVSGTMTDIIHGNLQKNGGYYKEFPETNSGIKLPMYREENGKMVKVSYKVTEGNVAGSGSRYEPKDGISTIEHLENLTPPYQATFYNIRQSTNRNITVKKLWDIPSYMEPSMAGVEATFQLYRKLETENDTKWAPVGAEWTWSRKINDTTPYEKLFTDLPTRNNNGVLYRYKVEETFSNTRFAATATSHTFTNEETEYTFENRIIYDNNINITKTVIDPSCASANSASKAFNYELYYVNTDAAHTARKVADGAFAQGSPASYTQMPAGNYYVKETGVPAGWDHTTELTTDTQPVNGGNTITFAITNTREITTMKATKVWEDDHSADTQTARPEVTFNLFAYDEVEEKYLNGSLTAVEEAEAFDTYPLGKVEGSKEWNDLPTHTVDGHPITYSLTETTLGNNPYTLTVNDKNPADVVFTNTLGGSIIARKQWVDDGTHEKPAVSFSLYGKPTAENPTGLIETKPLGTADYVTFDNVSYADALDTPDTPKGYFRVEETVEGGEWKGYTQIVDSMAGLAQKPETAIGGSVLFVNEYMDPGHADITFNKTWNDDSNPDRPALTVRLLSDYGNAVGMYSVVDHVTLAGGVNSVNTVTFPTANYYPVAHIEAWNGDNALPMYTYVDGNKQNGLCLVNYKVQEVVPSETGNTYTPSLTGGDKLTVKQNPDNASEKIVEVEVDETNTVAITNTIVGRSGTITAAKQWNVPWYLNGMFDGVDGVGGVNVVVSLWRTTADTDTMPKNVAEATAAGWEKVGEGAKVGIAYNTQTAYGKPDALPAPIPAFSKSVEDREESTGNIYKYVLIETMSGAGSENITPESTVTVAVPDSDYLFTNKYDRVAKLNVSKDITPLANENYTGRTFAYELSCNGNTVASGTLAGGDTVTLTNLAKNVSYTLTETGVDTNVWKDGQTDPASWSQTFTLTGDASKTLYNERVLAPDRTISKTWIDDKAGARPEAHFYLYAQVTDADGTWYLTPAYAKSAAKVAFMDTKVDGSAAEQTAEFTGMPTHTLDGERITYTVEEGSIGGYDQVQNGDSFVNTEQQNVVIQKQWNDKGGAANARPAVKFTLTGKGTSGVNKSVTLTAAEAAAANPNTITFPTVKYDPAGYTVTEEIVGENAAGYYASSDESFDLTDHGTLANGANATFENTRGLATVTVKKIISDITQDETAGLATEYKFTLTDGEGNAVTGDKSTIGNGGVITYTLNVAIDTDYTLTEEALTGYNLENVWNVGYNGTNVGITSDESVVGKATINVSAANASVIVTNSRKTTTLDVTKKWVDNSNTQQTRPAMIVLVPQVQEPTGWVDVPDYGKIVDVDMASNEQKYEDITFARGALALNRLDGTPYTYRVVEQGADKDGNGTIVGAPGSDAVYSSKLEGKQTIVNTLMPGEVRLSIDKEWKAGNATLADDKHPSRLKVVLHQNDGTDHPTEITLLKGEGGAWHWGGLMPRFNAQGVQYTYSVTEKDSDGNETTALSGNITFDGEDYTYEIVPSGTEQGGSKDFDITNTRLPDDPELPDKDPKLDTKVEISVENNGTKDAVLPGQIYTYEITYYNHTDAPATVTVADTLDEYLTYTGVRSATAGVLADDVVNGQSVTWTIENVPAFTGGVLSIRVQVADADTFKPVEGTPVIDNQASVTIGVGGDPVLTPPTEINVYNPTLLAEKHVVGKLMPDGSHQLYDYYTAGETVGYKVTITNTGNVTVSAIEVLDDHFAEGTTETLTDAQGNEVTTLAPGESASVIYNYVITPEDAKKPTLKNIAWAIGTDTEGGDVTSNEDDETIQIHGKATLKVVVEPATYTYDGTTKYGNSLPSGSIGNTATATYTVSGLLEGHTATIPYTPEHAIPAVCTPMVPLMRRTL